MPPSAAALTEYTAIPASGNAAANVSDVSFSIGDASYSVVRVTFANTPSIASVLAGKSYGLLGSMGSGGAISWSAVVTGATGEIDAKYLPRL